jgi:hypothetical protein
VRFKCLTPKAVVYCRRGLATLLFAAWLPGVYLLTFRDGPFQLISNAYFASWLVLYTSLSAVCMEWSHDGSADDAPVADRRVDADQQEREHAIAGGGGEYHEM